MSITRTGQKTPSIPTQRTTTTATGGTQTAQQTQKKQPAAGGRTAAFTDGFQAARAAPVALATPQVQTFREVLPEHAGKTTQTTDGVPLGQAALDRVIAHMEQTSGLQLNQTERTEWRNAAREFSKKGGSENDVWGEMFSRLNQARKNTPGGQSVLPSAAGKMETTTDGQPMNDAELDRVIAHVEQTFGRSLSDRERTAWRNEAREFSKKGGTENDVWGEIFSRLNQANKNVNGR